MRALRREDIGNFKSVLDNSTSEATGEMKKTTQVILNSIKTNVKNNISEEVGKAFFINLGFLIFFRFCINVVFECHLM